ncbi:MAG: ABC transporter substrate-binding protein [Phycisphaerales bacterium]
MKLLRSFSALLFISIFLWSCSDTTTNTGSSSTNGRSDSNDQEYRLAAMSPGFAVMLRDLGMEDQIVAKHDYDLVLSSQVPAAGSELGFDLEMLIECDPTHVFFQRTTTERSPELLSIASKRGWTIFERPLETLDDIAQTMDDLYYLFNGVPERETGEFDLIQSQQHTQPSESLAYAWRDRGPVADAAGRVLVLGAVDPIGAMGPGSYHHQLVQRLGATSAISEGAMWIELDYEDLIAMNPDSIIIIAPRNPTSESDDASRFGVPETPEFEDAAAMLGPIADLPISAMKHQRIGIVDHPLGLLPSGALGEVGDDIADFFEIWDR